MLQQTLFHSAKELSVSGKRHEHSANMEKIMKKMQFQPRSVALTCACVLASAAVALGGQVRVAADSPTPGSTSLPAGMVVPPGTPPLVVTNSHSVRSSNHPCASDPKELCYSVDTLTVMRPASQVGMAATTASANAVFPVYAHADHTEYAALGQYLYDVHETVEDQYDGTVGGLRNVWLTPTCNAEFTLFWFCNSLGPTGTFYDSGKGALTNWDNQTVDFGPPAPYPGVHDPCYLRIYVQPNGNVLTPQQICTPN
jgi:hypothetical protein